MKPTIENYKQAENALAYVKHQIHAGMLYDQFLFRAYESGLGCHTPCCIAGHLSIYRVGLQRHLELEGHQIVLEAMLALGVSRERIKGIRESLYDHMPWLFYARFEGGPAEVMEAWAEDTSPDKARAALLAIDVFLSHYRQAVETGTPMLVTA